MPFYSCSLVILWSLLIKESSIEIRLSLYRLFTILLFLKVAFYTFSLAIFVRVVIRSFDFYSNYFFFLLNMFNLGRLLLDDL